MLDPVISLIFYNNYSHTSVALFYDVRCIDVLTVVNSESSKKIVIMVDQLLESHNLVLSDCSFFGVHQGPGPFTTLRVVIASVNGLAYATKISLIGINGLVAFAHLHHNKATDYTVVLLNAFCGDLYYACYDGKNITMGCENRKKIFDLLDELPLSTITLLGNGAYQNQHEIAEKLSHKIISFDKDKDCIALEAVAQEAYKNWIDQKNLSNQLTPLYLKRPI